MIYFFFHTALEYSLSGTIEIRSWDREPHCGDNQYTKEMNAQSQVTFYFLFSQQLQLKWVFPTQPTIKSSDEACPDARHLPTVKFRSHQDNNQY